MRKKDMPETLRGQTNLNALGNRDRQPSREEMYSYTHFSTPTSDSNRRSSGGFGGGCGYNGCDHGGDARMGTFYYTNPFFHPTLYFALTKKPIPFFQDFYI